MDASYRSPFGTLGSGGLSSGRQQQSVITSGGSGVVQGGSGGRKSKKGLVILLIVLFLAIIGGAIAYVLIFGGNGDQQGTADVNSIKTSFNAYANYVLYGKESDAAIDMKMISDNSKPYFMDLDKTQEEDYSKKAKEKYDDFSSKYYESGGFLDLVPLKTYFQDYAAVPYWDSDELLAQYLDAGKEGTEKYIASRLSFSGVDDDLGILLQDLKDYYFATIDLVDKVNAKGCFSDGKVVDGCYEFSEEESNAVGSLMIKVDKEATQIRQKAFVTLWDLYSELYKVDSKMEGVGK